LMYILNNVKENVLVKFLSSISLEMFIIQFIPIYIMMNNLHVKSTPVMVVLVLVLDVILAYIMHMIVQEISARLR
jgi:peptidoglycan/LPS O-acetylase OafA/YrhL